MAIYWRTRLRRDGRVRDTIRPPAVERSRFYQGHYLTYARKGGKKDRKSGVRTTIGQIQFMQMLCNLKEDFLPQWMPFVKTLGLTAFEIESMVNLKCFQMLCKISNGVENYPDMFHLWTAQRNHIDTFLTLDKKSGKYRRRNPEVVDGPIRTSDKSSSAHRIAA